MCTNTLFIYLINTVVQWQEGQTRTWRWVSCSQRHHEHCHGLSPYQQLKATPFNMTVIQVYAPTSDYDDSEVEDFYGQLQEVIEETPKKDNLVVLGDWNAKVGKDAQNN